MMNNINNNKDNENNKSLISLPIIIFQPNDKNISIISRSNTKGNLIREGKTTYSNDSFRSDIKKFVCEAEKHLTQNYNVSRICEDYGFQKRRLYDVVNVLDALGCCKKNGVDNIVWLGLKNVSTTIQDFKKMVDENNIVPIPDKNCISISTLSKSFILMFLTKKTNTLDIKQMANWLSKENGRYKTTLCKLYQISFILESVGIVFKDEKKTGQIYIDKKYYDSQKEINDQSEAYSVSSLLSRPNVT